MKERQSDLTSNTSTKFHQNPTHSNGDISQKSGHTQTE